MKNTEEDMTPFNLPKSFLFGSATASLQIEGGDKNNSWYEWCEQGHIKDGTHCIVADDHWNRTEEDTALMKKMNHQIYRMGIEWSRIEPQKGQFSQTALKHYRDEIELLIKNKIKPMITLHHFSNPLWLEHNGAWLTTEVIGLFERYTEVVVNALGDLVCDWVTINEPNVYLAMGYITGEWPPGGKGRILEYFKGAKNMILAHICSYKKIHEIRQRMGFDDTMVGVANHMRIFDPKHGTKRERLSCWLHDMLFQELFIYGMAEGKLIPPIGLGYPMGQGPYMDFFGLNYYTRDIISGTWDVGGLFGKMEVKSGAEINDLGWELYPEGLGRICRKYYDRYKVPIYITENGTCDAKDAFRAKYIYDHILEIKKLIDEGVKVERYYHWTTMDNFEWVEGLSARFGLIDVNFDTQERTIRKSGQFYAELSKGKAVTQKMIDKYLK
jgi:beta-glucosidase